MRASFNDFNIYDNEDEACTEMCTPLVKLYFEITKEDLQSLLEGKILAGNITEEYGLFINMKKENEYGNY